MSNPAPPVLDRIVIFTLDSLQSAVVMRRLATLEGRVVAIVASRRYGKKYGSFVTQTRRNQARSGVDFVNYLGLQFFWFHLMALIASAINRVAGRPNRIQRLASLARTWEIPLIVTDDPNSPEIAARLTALDPDLFLSAYFDHVIRAPLIAIPRAGVINIHTALLPDLRGPFPGLWAMIRGYERVGVTVHQITDDTLDTGPILAQRVVPYDPAESVLALDCRLMRAGGDLAVDVIRSLEQGSVVPVPQAAGAGFYDSFPTRQDLEKLRVRGQRLWSLRDFVNQFFRPDA